MHTISETGEHCINANIRVRHRCNSVVRAAVREFRADLQTSMLKSTVIGFLSPPKTYFARLNHLDALGSLKLDAGNRAISSDRRNLYLSTSNIYLVHDVEGMTLLPNNANILWDGPSFSGKRR